MHSNLPNETTFVGLNFYNEGEVLHSTATNFTCWAERSIREIDRSLDAGFGEKGLVESTYAVQGTTPVTLVGILETSEEVTLPITAPEQTVTVTVFLPSICLPAQAIGGCMFIPGRGCPIVANGTVISCTGTAPPQFLEILATRDHAYSLYNDSTPVPTRFEPSAVTDAALAPSPGLTRIEETDRSIDYAGTGWVHGNMSFPWSGGTASFSRRAGDRATLSFSGTGVSWISFREARGGIARVFLDGTLVDEVDTFSTTTEIQAVVFTRSGLPAGPHTLAIEVTGTHNPASTTSDTVIVVDAFDVTP